MDVAEDSKILLKLIEITRLLRIKKAIFTIVKKVEVEYVPSSEPIPYQKRTENNIPIKKGKKWGGAFDCAWFHIKSDIPENVKGKPLSLLIDIAGEGLIVGEENEALQGINNPLSIPNFADYFNLTAGKTLYHLEDSNSEEFDIWLEAGYNGIIGMNIGKGKLRRAELAVYHKEIADFYFDYLSLVFAKVIYKGKLKKETSVALKKSFNMFLKKDILGARNELQVILSQKSESDLTVTAIGHSHLDLAWLWPIRETKRKAARTLSTAMKNLERYDNYIYGASQPQEFVWVKEMYPKLYDKILKATKEGRFEAQGGMWCECDTNITGGESLVRQFIYGLEFWEKEFGKKVNNCWLPDVFGYSATLPQIMKKCGIDYFMTQKLSWNEHNDFPYETFNWEGLSDDKVLVHLLPAYTYNSSGAAPSLLELYNNHKKKSKSSEALMLFGAGDGGGGPCEANIELLNRYQSLIGLPKVNIGRADEFFERIKKEKDTYPEYKGELYLEKHQGTFTTQSNNKKLNREIEFELHNLEALAAYAIKKGYEYPYDNVKQIWYEVMLYQFHDIIPGSSINRVYTESVERYIELISQTKEEINKILDFLDGKNELCAINTTSFNRIEYIKKDDKWYCAEIAPYSSSKLELATDSYDIKSSENSIENEYLKVQFDSNGEICSLVSKNTQKEFNGEYLNRLTIYKDKKLFYNAWDIDINYMNRRKSRFVLTSTKNYIDGPNAVMENHYQYGKSILIQKVTLKAGKPYIAFDTEVDWHEKHKMLRADFIPSVYSDKVMCDIQFGNISRSTKTDNKLDWAQFEIPAQKYIDVSDGEYGTALLSKSKYGFRVKDGLMSMNLLRSTVYPDKTADRGKHTFQYAFYPHKDSCFNSEVPKHAYLFNLTSTISDKNINLACLVKCNKRNIIIETIKPAEDKKGVIIRLYENEGVATKAEMEYGLPNNKVYLADMRENIESEAETSLNFEPYEIKTLYLI